MKHQTYFILYALIYLCRYFINHILHSHYEFLRLNLAIRYLIFVCLKMKRDTVSMHVQGLPHKICAINSLIKFVLSYLQNTHAGAN